jgi:hypothetical protein
MAAKKEELREDKEFWPYPQSQAICQLEDLRFVSKGHVQ